MQKNKVLFFSFLGCGISAGLINGFFGGGGGMIIVPVFTMLLKMENKKAHATAVLTILPVSIVGAITYAMQKGFDFSSGIPVIVGEVLGGLLGAFLLKKIPNKAVGIIFIAVMLFAGVKMLFL